jgi:hypothetical protein
MNHVAFRVKSETDLRTYRKRLIAANEEGLCGLVTPVIMHADVTEGFAAKRTDPTVSWVSIYFFGPDGELLELAAQAKSMSDRSKEVLHLPHRALFKAKTPH